MCFFHSSFAAHRATGGEPPQSAQDKARMDKEYLSLMAELGEAPVPTSAGGHTSTQGAPRAAGPNSTQPPPVSGDARGSLYSSCRELCLKFSVCSTEPASVDEFWSSREQELSRHAWGARWSWRTSQFSSSDAQHGRTAYASQPQWLASTLDAAPSSSHGPGTWTAWTPDG